MYQPIKELKFEFPDCLETYQGKVRDLYNIADEILVIVASDRISAFDHILPRAIPFKGQVLNQIAAHFLQKTKDIVPNHFESIPDPNVTIGLKCKPIPIEMVVRGYLCGHAWRTYNEGKRELCGVSLPDGLKKNDPLPTPIITPATKSLIGHDEDISEVEILKSGLLESEDYYRMRQYSLALFKRGTEMAKERGLILADTKYEFGFYNDQVMLIDEIHTPDSSRYFYLEGFSEKQEKGIEQKQLSKEFVREWLMENGFQGLEGQSCPEMPDEFVESVSKRYITLYETITGKTFIPGNTENLKDRIFKNTFEGIKAYSLK